MDNIQVEFNVLREIADLSLDGVVVYCLRDKKVSYANLHAFEMVGLTENASELELQAVLGSVVPQDREYLKNQYFMVCEKFLTAEVEFKVRNEKDGEMFLCCNAYLVYNKSAIIVFIKDITKPKEHENYLVNYGARKNTILDTLAHQVSGALNLMRHLSSEAEKYTEDTRDKNLKIYLRLLNDNSSHCLEIIQDLLKNEHEESAGIFVKNSRIDIVRKIAVIYDELQQSHRTRKFFFSPSVESLHITTDEVKLLQIVNNLTSNAIKFSHSEDPISITIVDAQDQVTVSVTDSGIGIPKNLEPLVFESQFGAGRTGLNGEKSIGLGLSICKNLIKLLNGTIWFESREGEGSTFYFSLPKS
ncbi:MAG TPA: sensor histidine kinase [Ohtaekwangia sp.]|nr:sensor histidine kinase [Ohtaekwangia sp.]